MNVATILENYSVSSEYNNPVLSFHINDDEWVQRPMDAK